MDQRGLWHSFRRDEHLESKPILNGPSGLLIQVISWPERGAERRVLARPRMPQALDPGQIRQHMTRAVFVLLG
jgi:hypothetical protein